MTYTPTPEALENYDAFVRDIHALAIRSADRGWDNKIMDDVQMVAAAALKTGWFEGKGLTLEGRTEGVAFEDHIFSAEFISMAVEAKRMVDNELVDESRALYSRTGSMQYDNERDAIREYLKYHFKPAEKGARIYFKAVDMVEAAIEQTEKTVTVEGERK